MYLLSIARNPITTEPSICSSIFGQMGDGYYFTDGKAIPIRWEKDTEWGPMRFVDAATGEEITVNQGKTWISIVPTVDMDKTKFE